jgi:hypothetical protein
VLIPVKAGMTAPQRGHERGCSRRDQSAVVRIHALNNRYQKSRRITGADPSVQM